MGPWTLNSPMIVRSASAWCWGLFFAELPHNRSYGQARLRPNVELAFFVSRGTPQHRPNKLNHTCDQHPAMGPHARSCRPEMRSPKPESMRTAPQQEEHWGLLELLTAAQLLQGVDGLARLFRKLDQHNFPAVVSIICRAKCCAFRSCPAEKASGFVDCF